MFVFEYQDKKGAWFGVNPLLTEMNQFRENNLFS